MKNKINITIGIPIHNEGKNILRLIKDLLKQNKKNFVLDKVIVLSDGSTDNSTDLIDRLGLKKIKLIKGLGRIGKPTRVNQIFSIVDSEVTVILDGDINLASSNTIDQLVRPFLKDKLLMLTSGRATPLLPKTLVQKIFYTGTQIWDTARSSITENEMYYCEGRIRAFRKNLYKKMRFPLTSAEDVFPFLYCKTKSYKFKPVASALVYYSLPKTTRDYLKQFRRFWRSEKIQEKNFGKELTDKYYSIGLTTKLQFAFKYFLKQPLLTTAYLVFLLLPKIVFLFNPGEASVVWEIAQSTKNEG